jgi:hypothetical protein
VRNKGRISISRRFVFVHASQAAATIYGAMGGEIRSTPYVINEIRAGEKAKERDRVAR